MPISGTPIAKLVATRRYSALLDQGIVSGTNFLAFLYCARGVPPDVWGRVGFAYAIVLFCQGFQRALVTIPMISLCPTRSEWETTAGSWAGLSARLSFVLAVLAGGTGAIALTLGDGWWAVSAAMAATMMVPLFSVEFARRALIQQERFGALVSMAAAYAAGVAVVLRVWPEGSWLQWAQPVAMIGGSIASLSVFAIRNAPLLMGARSAPSIVGHRRFSAWAALSHVGFSGYTFGIQAMLGFVSGPAALGVFHACRTLLQPVSTLISAMDSVDKPRAARAYALSGRPGLFSALRRAVAAILVSAGAYIAVAVAFDEQMLRLAYGPTYLDQGHVVALWGGVAALMALAQPLESGLYVIRRTREIFVSRFAASILSLASGAWLISRFGVAGALLAMVGGYLVTAVMGAYFLKRNA